MDIHEISLLKHMTKKLLQVCSTM